MVRFHIAASALITSTILLSKHIDYSTNAFIPTSLGPPTWSLHRSRASRAASLTALDESDNPFVISARLVVSKTSSYLESISIQDESHRSSSVSSSKSADADDAESKISYNSGPLAKNTQADSEIENIRTASYDISLPLYTNAKLGVTFGQVSAGRKLSNFSLDLDTVKIVDTTSIEGLSIETDLDIAVQFMSGYSSRLGNEGETELRDDFEGVVVRTVTKDMLAWNAGVRPGDVLLSTSATMGDAMWPKGSLVSVRSAISTRKVMNQYMNFKFQRLKEPTAATEVVENFELTLTRPIGINIEDTESGLVLISSFTEAPQSVVETALRVGDRIVAVDSLIGSRMWPVSNVEGLVSACTSRLPSQPVRLRFERVVQVGEWGGSKAVMNGKVESVSPALTGAVDGFRKMKQDSESAQTVPIKSSGSETHQLLLARCQQVLRQYAADNKSGKVMGLVADRILGALGEGGAPLDAKTLAMVMTAYGTSLQPENAIKAFEAATGLSGDGSLSQPEQVEFKGKNGPVTIIADKSALEINTVIALLRAHAVRGDVYSARRVLAATEGSKNGVVDDVPTSDWSKSKLLTCGVICYNIVIAAAAKAGGKDGIDVALDVFDCMTDPNPRGDQVYDAVTKDLVTYNTMISVFAKEGRSQDAYTIFYSIKQAGIKPDKYTYTSLIKSLAAERDIGGALEVLEEMKKSDTEVDVVTYNTLIKAFCQRLRLYEAKNLVTDMELNGVKADSMTYSLLMNGLLKAGKPGPCLTLFESAAADSRTVALTETLSLYTTAITAASALGDFERGFDLFSRMKQAGIKPNLKTLTALMGACLSADEPIRAIEIFNQVKSSSVTLDGQALAKGLRAYCDAGNFTEASEILSYQSDGYKEMKGRQIMEGYNYLLHSSLEAENFQVARDTMTELLQGGYIPSKMTYKTITHGLDLLPKKQIRGMADISNFKKKLDPSKFNFLMFVLDSISERKLICEGLFYSIIISEGQRLGGRSRFISSLLMNAKREGLSYDRITPYTWSDLTALQQNELLEKSLDAESLPSLQIRIGQNDAYQVSATEKALFFSLKKNKIQ
mmetsp:Transcript_13730/g.15770  ORF Transcript_13730/g.15770 Transcript_13730/m.15770 type:complete len:1069 (-) Transcript_13730:152-3358(-)